ncbi:Hypothetical predicted protein, partial [Podarcis lilfordi]
QPLTDEHSATVDNKGTLTKRDAGKDREGGGKDMILNNTSEKNFTIHHDHPGIDLLIGVNHLDTPALGEVFGQIMT